MLLYAYSFIKFEIIILITHRSVISKMSRFNIIEIKSNGEKNYYLEGYVSTTDPDFVNDIVDNIGQKAVFKELKNKQITMDEDHNEWRDPKTGKYHTRKKNKFPLAKVVDVKLDNKGTWVKAELNKYHPDFEKKILPMIKEGYLHSFSIAYNVTKSFTKLVNNVKYRIIQGLNLANIAITGNPVNSNAKFNVILKSISRLKMEENTITQEEFNTLQNNHQELKSQFQDLEQELSELKGQDYKKMYEELKAKYDKMQKEMKSQDEEEEDDTKEMKSFNKELVEIKSNIERLEAENKELRHKLEQPMLKSKIQKVSEEPNNNVETKSKVSMMELI